MKLSVFHKSANFVLSWEFGSSSITQTKATKVGKYEETLREKLEQSFVFLVFRGTYF